MTTLQKVPTGSHHYRAFVGPIESYDLLGALQFSLLTSLGLREQHFLLDIGCGSLRAGRLFIPYLQPMHYCGIEPNFWLVKKGIENECGADLVAIKKPQFDDNTSFSSTVFKRKFDFVLAHSIFTHAGFGEIRQCLRETIKSMKPGTILAATFMEGKSDYSGDEWVYPNVVRYKTTTMRDLAESFDLYSQQIDWPHPNNHTWLLISPDKDALPKSMDRISARASSFRTTSELEYYKQRVHRLESRAYVKLGMRLNELVKRVTCRSPSG